ncbi:MAG TPA: plastocyanin/azurin family copper-binding protein [Acidimicrobiia bacterium]|nr:plastocyanin/azurin family copper-binding protein [Acidimicrobiia bacterium]
MRVTRLLALAAAVALVAACSGDGGEAGTTIGAPDEQTTQAVDTTTAGTPAAPSGITIENFDFSGPDAVAVGTTVTVTNQDNVSHTWTSEDDVFDSGSLGQGESFQFTFDEAGEYTFVCTIHPGMSGSITVEG